MLARAASSRRNAFGPAPVAGGERLAGIHVPPLRQGWRGWRGHRPASARRKRARGAPPPAPPRARPPLPTARLTGRWWTSRLTAPRARSSPAARSAAARYTRPGPGGAAGGAGGARAAVMRAWGCVLRAPAWACAATRRPLAARSPFGTCACVRTSSRPAAMAQATRRLHTTKKKLERNTSSPLPAPNGSVMIRSCGPSAGRRRQHGSVHSRLTWARDDNTQQQHARPRRSNTRGHGAAAVQQEQQQRRWRRSPHLQDAVDQQAADNTGNAHSQLVVAVVPAGCL